MLSPHTATTSMASLDWLLTALQRDDADVASLALLRLWQCVQRGDLTGRAELTASFSSLPTRAWRRLGLLLFTNDAVTIRAVVGIMMTLAVSHGGTFSHQPDGARQLVHQRIWQSDWRQFVLDKLIDCHTRAATVHGEECTSPTSCDDVDVSLRLAVVLRAVFLETLQSGLATPKDQARIVEVFVELALSPLDAIACVALQTLQLLLQASADLQLDSDVHSYLQTSNLLPDLMTWLHASRSLASPTSTTKPMLKQRSRHHRQCLVLHVLSDAATQSAEVAHIIAQLQSDGLLRLVLDVAEYDPRQHGPLSDHHELQASAVTLLAVVLKYDTPTVRELASAIRLRGTLITVAWLFGHTSRAVCKAANEVMTSLMRLSSPRDLLRALMEQGCVLICYTFLADEKEENANDVTPCRVLLHWIAHQLETTQAQLVQSMAASVLRSTNAKLQRNVILSLLLLSQSSDAVHDALFRDVDTPHFFHGIMNDVILSSDDDASLAITLLAAALLCSDKSSTLKVDAAVSSASLRKLSSLLEPPPAIDSSFDVAIVCASGERIIVDSVTLVTPCKFFARGLKRLDQSTKSPPGMPQFDLPDHDAATLNVLLRILPMPPQQAALELQRLNDLRMVEQLLRLAKAVECTKGWHAASLIITSALDVFNWRSALDVAVEVRHPALLLRALRAALAASTRAVSPDVTRETALTLQQDLKDAALLVWRELLNVDH